MEVDAYRDSSLVKKVAKTRKIAFLDIDATMTSPDKAKQEMARKKLEKAGYAVVYVTSRTYETNISDEKRRNSHDLDRPESKSGVPGKLVHVDPAKMEEMRGLLDPDVMIDTTGTNIAVLQKNGKEYKIDKEFRAEMKSEAAEWRSFSFEIMDVVNAVARERLCVAREIEHDDKKYHSGHVGVYLPDYRVQIDFDNLEKKKHFVDIVNKIKVDRGSLKLFGERFYKDILNLKILDESRTSTSEISVHLMPRLGGKERAVEKVVDAVTRQLDLSRKDLKVLIAGDSYADLSMGLYGAARTNATFLLVGGSRLKDVLTTEAAKGEQSEFAGEKLSALKTRFVKDLKSEEAGDYEYKAPMLEKREVVVGDEAFPGTKAAETIIAFLEKRSRSGR